MTSPMKRITKRTNKAAVLVALWVPIELLTKLDASVHANDTDRSKFIRRCIKASLQSGR